jgi:hypothetical protein
MRFSTLSFETCAIAQGDVTNAKATFSPPAKVSLCPRKLTLSPAKATLSGPRRHFWRFLAVNSVTGVNPLALHD